VCALPNSDLEITAVLQPASRASIAARSPAPPAPITTTSYWCRSIFVIACPFSVEEPQIREPPGGQGHDVEVRQRQRAQGDPGELHVSCVDLGDEGPPAVADRVLGEV